MNKKILFLILFVVILVLPAVAYGVESDLCVFMGNVKDLILNIGGTIVVIGWVIAGILWLTSGGSPTRTETAKKAVIAAVVGTILVVISASAYPLIKGALGSSGTWFSCTGNPQ